MRNALAHDSRVDWSTSVSRPREESRRDSTRRYLPAAKGRRAVLTGYRRAERLGRYGGRRSGGLTSSPALIVGLVFAAGAIGGLVAWTTLSTREQPPAPKPSPAAIRKQLEIPPEPVASRPAAAAEPLERGAVTVQTPFSGLAAAGYSERLAAFAALLPRAAEVSAKAFVEINVLRAHQKAGRHVPRPAIEALEDLRAEAGLLAGWEEGLPACAEGVKGSQFTVNCSRTPVAEALRMASRSWGVRLELSPGARRLLAALDLELSGTTDLEGFLRWVTVDRSRTYGGILVVGHVGDTVVLVPAESLNGSAAAAK
jgi:hypothetical protein